ncbi:MAG: MBL fold metallo-hydrolase [Patescibacteria group bacterium]
MKIKFLGAAGTVTGSSYVLTSGSGQSILIDLGMFLGTQKIDALNYDPYDFDCTKLSGAILTHAHLDHCGRLPILLPKGFTGNIWMTPSTLELTEVSLIDSAKLAKYQEKSHILFDTNLAEQTFARFKTTQYHTPVTIGNFMITMKDAGHILGSALLEIVDSSADSEIKKIVFSGDLGNSPEDLLKETELVDDADAVVMESTYGDRLHPGEISSDALLSEIQAIESSGGTLLIPAFALDRTQELLHMIMHLKKDGKIQAQTPIFLDNPMAEKATYIYDKYPTIFNDHIQSEFISNNPFTFPGLEIISKGKDSKRLHATPGPKVIIAGSGMMTGGRVLGHAAHYLPIASTRLFIVGYQGEETLGRALMEGEKLVTIDRVPVPVNCTVGNTQAMSSHADQKQLLQWLKHIKNVKKVFLTHGEDGPRTSLSQKISENLGLTDVTMPVMNQEIRL